MKVPVGSNQEMQEIDPRGQSIKQIEALKEIATAKDFHFFCSPMNREGAEYYQGPITWTYYTQDGKIHAKRISVTGRILNHTIAE